MSERKPLPSQEYLKECFEYDSEKGILTWKERPDYHFEHLFRKNYVESWNQRLAGSRAGYIRRKKGGYARRHVTIDGSIYMEHRVIWKLLYNEEPQILDHADGNATNNRIGNISKTDFQRNSGNRSKSINNSTGITGVSFRKDQEAWCVSIRRGGKNIHLKQTKDFFEACCVRKSAELGLDYSERHGKEVAWYHQED